MSSKSKRPRPSKLPGGIPRADYQWPHVSCLYPEHGVYEMDVHCTRSPNGAMTLIAFLAHTKPNSADRRKQIDMVADIADGVGHIVVPLNEADISRDIALELAAYFHANPDSEVSVIQVMHA